MRVLVACEYSATVSNAFRRLGHEAWSNDILPTEGDPAWHIQGHCEVAIASRQWDLIIVHIPCTAMAVCGNSTYGAGMPKHQERIDALKWSLRVWDFACHYSDRVAMENPASVLFPMLRAERGADVQYVQPYQFGHLEQKKTGFALHGLPRLKETHNVYAEMMKLPKHVRERVHYMSPGKDRAKERARFYAGFADAMANQWSDAHDCLGDDCFCLEPQYEMFA
jgi:hypothetical protein